MLAQPYAREYFSNKHADIAKVLRWLNDPRRHFLASIEWWFVGDKTRDAFHSYPQLKLIIHFGCQEDAVRYDIFLEHEEPRQNKKKEVEDAD